MYNKTRLTDEQLVKAYAAGDNKAFDTLLERHQQRVFSYILFIVKNRDLADDIFQETFVKAITTIRQGRYTDSGKFSAWLTRIAHNLIIDHYRQVKSEAQVSADDDNAPDLLNRAGAGALTVEQEISEREITRDVRRLIADLPKAQRDVLVMRYYKNMSFKEIADATKVSINTALGRMRYALLNMRRMADERNLVLSLG